ncbi:MAG: DUF3810 domain-containing protein [Pseudobacter sp.]|uniref:DUF3810 domain-containing protein n=1 Tax=Pseudobacter sp. TaxID=2045420 RepID=UPI003F7E920F
MFTRNKALFTFILLAIVIKIFSLFPEAVERYYSNGIYPVIGKVQRALFGWIPFSVGDIFYAVLVLLLLNKLVVLVRKLRRKETHRGYWLAGLKQFIWVVVLVYVFFNGLWALNYNRLGIAKQLNLQVSTYTQEELVAVMETITERLETLDSSSLLTRNDIGKKKLLFSNAVKAYDSLAVHNQNFDYSFRSVKPSIYSYLGNYLGFTGYYNPFSGEAQVNTTVPLFIQPFTACHEIGHQLGYAKENEANFAGYLAAKHSSDAAFRYSVYFDLYTYSWYYLYNIDSAKAKQFSARLPVIVKNDYKELKEFNRKHRNPVERVIDKLYGEYLKANQQPSGKLAYNEVIAWLVAYYKKNGKDAI